MSAVVCGKRSSTLFEEPPYVSSSVNASKRARLAGSSAPREPGPDVGALLGRLRSQFGEMGEEIIEKALEAAGNDIDLAIKSLLDLRLEVAEASRNSAVGGANTEIPAALNNSGVAEACENNQPGVGQIQLDGPEWVDLLVREMVSASDMNDAKTRASRVLEVLEKSISSRVSTEAFQSLQKENAILKEQLDASMREHSILKRAVAIQFERQKELEARNQEVQQLKELVSQYQEQVRTLELNNYALAMHLRQAQQSSSIPGRFHPDVF